MWQYVTEFEEKIAEYAMQDCWPSVVAGIELGWETNDSLETFDITWTFNQWVNLGRDQSAMSNLANDIVTPIVNKMKDAAVSKIESLLDKLA